METLQFYSNAFQTCFSSSAFSQLLCAAPSNLSPLLARSSPEIHILSDESEETDKHPTYLSAQSETFMFSVDNRDVSADYPERALVLCEGEVQNKHVFRPESVKSYSHSDENQGVSQTCPCEVVSSVMQHSCQKEISANHKVFAFDDTTSSTSETSRDDRSSSSCLSLLSERDFQDDCSTSGCSCEMAFYPRSRERRRQKVKGLLKEPKALVPRDVRGGHKPCVMGTLDYVVSCMRKLSEQQEHETALTLKQSFSRYPALFNQQRAHWRDSRNEIEGVNTIFITSEEDSQEHKMESERSTSELDRTRLSSLYRQMNYSLNMAKFLMSHPKTFSESEESNSMDLSYTDDSEAGRGQAEVHMTDVRGQAEVHEQSPVSPDFGCRSSAQGCVSQHGVREELSSLQSFSKKGSIPTQDITDTHVLSLTEDSLRRHTQTQELLHLQRQGLTFCT